MIVVSCYFIKANGLLGLAGLTQDPMTKKGVLLFPLLYLVLLNALFMDDLYEKVQWSNMAILLLYCLSVGISEELGFRGVVQSMLIKTSSGTKKGVVVSVVISSILFGLIHLIRFDKGIYGEISQVFFAGFIGMLFGLVLLLTKRIYPLIIIHTLIDFAAKLDKAGIPIQKKISDPTSLENSILTVLLVLPCLIYSLFLIKRNRLDIQSEHVDRTTTS
ncbi:CPBP family intramembrane glutamic endopeptidase [Flagellimonas sp. DF-77]|uniref:CPBP family intramembrane glutamic endopeptidase n=1 Tax=Flagellimonas algarum TaxID=3230298 RepID=UPI0033911A19